MTSRKLVTLPERQAEMRERNAPTRQHTDEHTADVAFAQRHYTIPQIAKLWNLSPDAVRGLFEGEPGVLVLGGNQGRGRRRYATLRIPETVVERVYRKKLSR